MVVEYLQCGDDTEHDIIQLLATLYIDIYSKPTNMVRRQRLFVIVNVFVNRKYPLIISFALVGDISLRSVLGLSSLLYMGATLT